MVNSIDTINNRVNISRGPINKWNREAATLDFKLSKDINIHSALVGSKIMFTFEIDEGELYITEIRPDQSESIEQSETLMEKTKALTADPHHNMKEM